jgi:hypothetical protein
MTCMRWPAAAAGCTAPPPRPGARVAGTVTYGLALQAWCVYLIAAHAIPVQRGALTDSTELAARKRTGSECTPPLIPSWARA